MVFGPARKHAGTLNHNLLVGSQPRFESRGPEAAADRRGDRARLGRMVLRGTAIALNSTESSQRSFDIELEPYPADFVPLAFPGTVGLRQERPHFFQTGVLQNLRDLVYALALARAGNNVALRVGDVGLQLG